MAASPLAQNFPGQARGFVDKDGTLSQVWYDFLRNLYDRTGGSSFNLIESLLDGGISNVPGSILYRGSTSWIALAAGANGYLLQMVGGFPAWGAFSAANFGSQSASNFLASPASASGVPGFRSIASADLSGLAGQYPGTTTGDNGAGGNIGQTLSNAATATAMVSGTANDIGTLTLSPGDWDVWGSLVTNPAATTTQSQVSGWLNTTSATDPGPPNGGAYARSQAQAPAGQKQVLPLGMMTMSVSTSTVVYLSALVTFATSTLTASGFIGARRRR